MWRTTDVQPLKTTNFWKFGRLKTGGGAVLCLLFEQSTDLPKIRAIQAPLPAGYPQILGIRQPCCRFAPKTTQSETATPQLTTPTLSWVLGTRAMVSNPSWRCTNKALRIAKAQKQPPGSQHPGRDLSRCQFAAVKRLKSGQPPPVAKTRLLRRNITPRIQIPNFRFNFGFSSDV